MSWMVANMEAEFLVGFRAPLLAAVLALVVSWLLTPVARKLAIAKGAVDDTARDARRVHKELMPKWGGLAIYAGICVGVLLVLPLVHQPILPYTLGILLVGGFLVVVGALDDLYEFGAKIQAPMLLAAGVAVQFFASAGSRIQIETLAIPLSGNHEYIRLIPLASILVTAAYIFVVTKTMDTIDGVDGLAAGIATISATTLCIVAFYGQQPRVAIIAAAVAGSAIGFLRHNYNPAKIFMGTGGAYILGFTLACLSVVGAFKTAAFISLLIPVTVFGVPVVDAFVVITRRLLSHQPITQADKRHLHHQLLGKGLSPKQTMWVMCLAAIMLCSAVLFAVVKHA
jgi:UDP-GlcNAc:undecaprenyl-phosphate/decaprenyl-phosphate GlcNAc-1-phosphate transferase